MTDNIDMKEWLTIEQLEKLSLMYSLRKNNHDFSETAKELGISKAKVHALVKKYKIEPWGAK